MSPRAKFWILLLFVYGPMIIVPHELGHMAVFKHYGVEIKTASFGFGPTLAEKKVGSTNYKLSLLPLGGYVEPNEKQMKDLTWWKHLLGLLAGPFTGFLMFFPLLFLMKWKNKWRWEDVNLAHGFWELFTFLTLFFAVLNLMPFGFFDTFMLDGCQMFFVVWFHIGGTPPTFMYYAYLFFSTYFFIQVVMTPIISEKLQSIFRPWEPPA